MRRVAIYVRISDDREGAGLGVARQEADCRQRAETAGWSVVDVYCDNDLSAYSGKPRPEYRRMLRDLEDDRVDVVAVKAGPVDLSTPAGRAVARTLGAWARYESEHKAEREPKEGTRAGPG